MRNAFVFILKIIYGAGVVLCGFYSICLTAVLAVSLSGMKISADIPKYPQPGFWGMLALLVVMYLNTAWLFAGKSETFKKVVIGVDYLLGGVSLLFIAAGLLTHNRFTGDETNIGLVWVSMAVIFRILILLKEMQAKGTMPFGKSKKGVMDGVGVAQSRQ